MARIRMEDTIAAVVTPPGEGGIAVIRVSGPDSVKVAGRIFRSASGTDPSKFASHTIHLGFMVDAAGCHLDQVLLSLFHAPHSYTGEDVIEFSLHGGLAVTRLVLDRVLESGARMAEPGEFTKRAFLNGKIDLTQAEAVVDVIRARSDRSRDVALRQLEGGLSLKLRTLREKLMKTYAHMEAFVDFPEEDIEVYSDAVIQNRLQEADREIESLAAGFRRGALLREGISCVIIGRPNAGKSSLFNALLERDRALVSELEGTTRDVLEESIEIDGFNIRLSDTAGLSHDSENPLDRIGMEKTREVLAGAGLVLFMLDGSQPLDERDRTIFKLLKPDRPFLAVLGKSDLEPRLDPDALKEMTGCENFVTISATERRGLDALEKQMIGLVAGESHGESEQITRLRHKKALEAALAGLRRARKAFEDRVPLDLVILDLKQAMDEISELIGEIYSEDLLDVIFSEFCIGK